MKDGEFREMVRDQHSKPLLADVGLMHFQHVERLGNEEVEGLLDGEVIVETKLDGANLTVAWYEEHGIVVATRNQVAYIEKNEGNQGEFAGAVGYVLKHGGILTMAYMGYILRGEWLIAHSVQYAKDNYAHFYVYDVQHHTGQYVHPDEWMPIAQENGVRYIPVRARMTKPTIDQLVELVAGPDEFGAPQKEGIVVKRYDFVNKWGRTTWGKLVSADFKEKNRLIFGPHNDDPIEMRFVGNVVTNGYVMKTIGTMQDEAGRKLTVRDMGGVLQRVWHDAFTEEMYDFVKKESVGAFDFKAARKLCEKKTREVALMFFNGIPTIHGAITEAQVSNTRQDNVSGDQ